MNSLVANRKYDLSSGGACQGTVKTVGPDKVLEVTEDDCAHGYSLTTFMTHYYPDVNLKTLTRGAICFKEFTQINFSF